MLVIDHIAASTPDRDGHLSALAAALDVRVVDGWRPEGVVVGRGVKFSSGRFLDLHQASLGAEGGARLALAGGIEEVAAISARRGWKAKLHRPSDFPESVNAPPWSTLSFSRGQGLLSHLFVIEYHSHVNASAQYAQPLYDRSAGASTREPPDLIAIWIAVADMQVAKGVTVDLGGRGGDIVESCSAPFYGHRFQFGGADLFLANADRQRAEGVCRVDISTCSAPGSLMLTANVAIIMGKNGGNPTGR